jgi:hypothetical protein
MLPSPSSSSFFLATQRRKEGDGTVAAITFFRSTALQHSVAFFAMLRYSATPQTNKINERKKKKMLTWVPRGSCSNSSRSPAPSSLLQAHAPSSLTSSSFPLDVSGALAME